MPLIPSITHVMKKRHHVRRRLRFGGTVLVVIAVVFFIQAVVGALIQSYAEALLFSAPMVASFLIPGLLLILIDAPLSRRLVPMPKARCPRCNYDVATLTEPLCPECGLELPDALLEPEAPPNRGPA